LLFLSLPAFLPTRTIPLGTRFVDEFDRAAIEDSEAAASERFNSSEMIYRLWRLNRAHN
jgi:hypothetical protein